MFILTKKLINFDDNIFINENIYANSVSFR